MRRGATLLFPFIVALLLAACGPHDPEFATVRNPIKTPVRQAATADASTGAHDTAAVQQAVPRDSAADTTALAVTGAAGAPAAAVPALQAVDKVDLSAPMTFMVDAKVGHDSIHIDSDELSDRTGTAFAIGGDARGGGMAMNVVRFAHFGKADSPYAFRWVLYMEKGVGRLTGRRVAGGRYEVELRGDLHFDVIMKGATIPIRTDSYFTPVFRGTAKSWPPYGVVLRLANGPIPFYSDRQKRRDSTVTPMVLVTSTTFGLGKEPTAFFTKQPLIERATVIDPSGGAWRSGRSVAGVALAWESTADLLRPIAIAGYNVYRNSSPGNPASWERIATVPATQTTLIDSTYTGRSKVAYMVTHLSDYPTGYKYEGLRPVPTIVEAVR
jgi:hypothetical protein